MKRLAVVAAVVGAATSLALAPAAQGRPVSPAHHAKPSWSASTSLGTTTVTTAPGIATTLLKAGIAPLPQRGTKLGISFRNGVQVSYGFPITGSTANLAAGTGDITHSGGITFVSRKASLAIGNFDISLADGTVYATKVNGGAAKVATLLLDLSGLKVTTTPRGDTLLSGIKVKLAGQAASALNATFGTALPTDGSLQFGTATVLLKG
ncbi:MAG: hypothetical protein ACTHMS_18070 [Jatrophihabitans sp.]|uniref:hypothetical protein n=1 Tax=Jatrophihabitans sp. TaxID=1932789 RepID=UPI003F815A5B